MAFNVEDVEPPGIYYSLDTYNPSTEMWESLIVIRKDSKIEIPHDQVKLVNDQVVFAFLGWMYVVTTDGGKTWSKWDAENSLSGWQCCDSQLIKNVDIEPNGSGKMVLRLIKQQEKILYTKDYGKSWDN